MGNSSNKEQEVRETIQNISRFDLNQYLSQINLEESPTLYQLIIDELSTSNNSLDVAFYELIKTLENTVSEGNQVEG